LQKGYIFFTERLHSLQTDYRLCAVCNAIFHAGTIPRTEYPYSSNCMWFSGVLVSGKFSLSNLSVVCKVFVSSLKILDLEHKPMMY